MEHFHKHPIGMKTHHDGVFSSVIDIMEGRMIDTNTLIENERKEGEIEDDCDCYWKWVDWIWDLGFEKHAKRGMIEQGIDVDGIDVIIRDICDAYD